MIFYTFGFLPMLLLKSPMKLRITPKLMLITAFSVYVIYILCFTFILPSFFYTKARITQIKEDSIVSKWSIDC